MRVRLILCIVLPICILALGAATLIYTRRVTNALEAPLDALNVLAEEAHYAQLLEQLDALDALWTQQKRILQFFIDHKAIDDVSIELGALRAAATARSLPDALNAIARLREHAQHLLHRDLPIPENIL